MLASQQRPSHPHAPKARGDLSLQEVGEDGLLYDREGAMVHILNRTALFVWRHCDGSRSAEQIAAALRAAFRGTDGPGVDQDVARVLAHFAERGLLERT